MLLITKHLSPEASLAACEQVLQFKTIQNNLKQFKIKISGDLGSDLKRLIEIAEVITINSDENFAFSLDGNEQFESIEAFRKYWMNLNKEKIKI